MERSERARREAIVIADYGSVIPYAQVFYLASIIYSAEAGLVAYARYHDQIFEPEQEGLAAAAIHEALGHAAGLSRFFWPPRDGLAAARAESLRNDLRVAEASPLKNRTLRNALEHFDERLDAFLLTDAVGLLVPEPIVANSSEIDDPTAKIFKLVDPWNGVYVLFNEHFKFGPIFDEVSRIFARAHDLYHGTDYASEDGI